VASIKPYNQTKTLGNGETKTYSGYRISVDVNSENKRFVISCTLNKKQKIAIEKMLNDLETANTLGLPPDEEVMKQVKLFSQEFLDKLEKIGLIEKQDKSLFQLDKFFDYVLEKQAVRLKGRQIAETTYNKLTYVRTHFLNHMMEKSSSDCDIRKITVEDCKNFADKRLAVAAPATVHTEVKKLRQIFFATACDMRLLEFNPFAKVQVKETVGDKRRIYLDSNLLLRAFRAIPTDTARQQNYSCWFALLRWTGARRSEPLLLKWKMINWENGRITMPAPKTERYGIPERTMPIFDELYPILEQHWHNQNRPSLEAYVVQDCMQLPKTGRTSASVQEKNPTSQWTRWMKAAGVNAWEKLAQNLRVTRENELLQSAEYRADAVHAFIGHSKDTYEANYKKLNDNDFVPLSKRELDRSTTIPPRNDQKPTTNVSLLSYDKKIDPRFAGLGGGCSEQGSPLAPPAGEERNEKVSEFEQVGASFHHNSTTEQLFELLEKLKDELLRRIND